MSISWGFTLIEQLVVIVFIGLLASTVLASLSSVRLTARDARVQQQMNALATQIELFRTSGSNPYGANFTDDSVGECTDAAISPPIGSDFRQPSIIAITDDIHMQSGGGGWRVFCAVNGTTWAMAARLNNPQSGTTGWCVDSGGSRRPINVAFNAANNTTLTSSGSATCP